MLMDLAWVRMPAMYIQEHIDDRLLVINTSAHLHSRLEEAGCHGNDLVSSGRMGYLINCTPGPCVGMFMCLASV
jgi:hypothetical protein